MPQNQTLNSIAPKPTKTVHALETESAKSVQFSDMLIPRWRNLVTLSNYIVPPLSQSPKSTHFARFHATPVACGRWRGKVNPDKSGEKKPSKAQIRITVRQNRADSKKALKNLLNRYSFQPASSNWAAQQINSKKTQSGSARHTAKPNKKKTTSKSDGSRRESYYYDDYEYSERAFERAFRDRWNTWSDKKSRKKSSFEHSYEYEWTRYSRQPEDENETDDESSFVGSHSDRKTLGLPLTGPLKIEDVKIAFRLSALKWHPDKHPGPSQEMAEEKFKSCHNAYQSLCKVLGL